MMNLTQGTSSMVWLALRESLPYGYTQSLYKLTITEPLSNVSKIFYPTATETGYKWSKFTISVGTPESSSTASSPTIDLSPGILHYIVTDTVSGNELNKGLVRVHSGTVSVTPTITRTKSTSVYKRN